MEKVNTLRARDTSEDDWVSALFDGEFDADEGRRAVVRLGKDADAARLWSEYSLIGDAMRGCLAERPELGQRIRAALADEPTVLAPAPVASGSGRTYYWMAAAAAVAAISWGVLSVSPETGTAPVLPVAANTEPGMASPVETGEVMSYLAAHQDYAYAVVGAPEMRFTNVSLAGEGR